MDANTISHLLASTLVVDKVGTRQQAEAQLKALSPAPGFVVTLLQLIQATPDISLKMSAAVYLKNTIMHNWDPRSAENLVSEQDKAIIRENIFPVMGGVPKNVRGLLSAAITEICKTDFPHIWTNILDLFITGMTSATDIDSLDNALNTAHSVLVRYREIHDEALVESTAAEVKDIARKITAPLMSVMARLATQVGNQADSNLAEAACIALSTAFDVLQDLTYQFGISDEFAADMTTFNQMIVSILGLHREDLLASEYSNGALTDLKSNAVSVIALLTRVSNEDFEPFVPHYMQTIWNTITNPASAYGPSDELVINCLEFIISVVNSPQYVFFDNVDTFQKCCESVILPNLAIFDSDLELMKDEPDAYIAREVEGSNTHTRRRAACDVIRALMKALPRHNGIFAQYVQSYATEATDWKKKATLLTLVTAVSLSGNTSGTQRGATQLTNLLPFSDFFNRIVVPLLTPTGAIPAPNTPESILAADAIRFVTTFRLFLLHDWQPIFERLAAWLASPDHITASFAAHALERWIAIRSDNTATQTLAMSVSLSGQPSEYRITSQMIAPVIGPILGNLCDRVAKEKKPNMFMMLCLMRFCMCVPQAVADFVPPIIQHVAIALAQACKNPTNPIYNHAMFEVISCTIAIVPQHAIAIEGTIWQQLFEILSKDVVEFVPYSLQIMGQLLDARGTQEPLPEHYYQVLVQPLLSPQMYEQPGTIPGAVRMLTAVIRKDAAFLERNGLIENVLQVFNGLLFLKKHDHDGMNVMIALVMSLPFENLGGYINQVYVSLFRRLQQGNTPKYTRCIILFFSVLIIHHGVERVVTAVNSIQNGLFWMYLNNVWLKNMQKVTGAIERTCCVAALANLVCQSPTLQAERSVWSDCVRQCLRMIHSEAERDDHQSFVPKFLQIGDLKDSVGDGGFVNAFCPLTCAVAKPVNPCAHITNANDYFRQSMSALVHSNPEFDTILRLELAPELYVLVH